MLSVISLSLQVRPCVNVQGNKTRVCFLKRGRERKLYAIPDLNTYTIIGETEQRCCENTIHFSFLSVNFASYS